MQHSLLYGKPLHLLSGYRKWMDYAYGYFEMSLKNKEYHQMYPHLLI